MSFKNYWNRQLRKHAIYSDRIRPLIRPVFHSFSLSQFSYFSVDDQGNSVCICNDHERMEEYLDQGLFLENPFLRDPSILPSGYYISKKVDIERDSLIITKNMGCKVKGFSFSWKKGEGGEQVLLNELPLLRRFCLFFEEEAKKTIRDVESDPINLLPILENKFYGSSVKIKIDANKRKDLLSLMGICEPNLSQREKECLRLCVEGESARTIGLLLHLSNRTVESYLENLKSKLSCNSKKELIKKAIELIDLGIL